MAQYPPRDSGRPAMGARILGVKPESPADDAGFEPGCYLTSVDGQPLRDIIDWRWLSGEECIEVGYVDLDNESGTVELWRDQGEEWGFEFDGLVFDGVRQCRNACTFCFMRQLPKSMRPSLYLRDDDFRLSFLVGTFVTLTNMTPEDETRIIEQRISPLRVSLQAVNPHVRRRIIGRHAQQGIESLDRLLGAGIEFHAQIVLVPGENDGDVLRESLEWAYERPGILGIGIVPLGYTRYQSVFDHSYGDPGDARALLETIAPFQRRALEERETPWVYAADEFYRNAWRDDLIGHIPPTGFYGDFEMFEDGIGIIRSTIDDWALAESEGSIAQAAEALRKTNRKAFMIAGMAQREFLDPLVAASGIQDVFRPLYIRNSYFGGNVDVTGLLVARDVIDGILGERSCAATTSAQPGVEPCDTPAFSPGEDGNQETCTPGENDFLKEGGPCTPGETDSCTPGETDPPETEPAQATCHNRAITSAATPSPEVVAPLSACTPGVNATCAPEVDKRAALTAFVTLGHARAIAPGESEPANTPGAFARNGEHRDESNARGAGAPKRTPASNGDPGPLFLIPRVVFNDDGLTLDDLSLHDMEMATGCPLHVVSCSPREYFNEIAALARADGARG